MDLAKGMQKYGYGEWTKMLKDPTFKFHCTRTPDKLKKRADSETLKCKFDKLDVQWNLVVKNISQSEIRSVFAKIHALPDFPLKSFVL